MYGINIGIKAEFEIKSKRGIEKITGKVRLKNDNGIEILTDKLEERFVRYEEIKNLKILS